MTDETKTEAAIEEFSKRELGEIKVLMIEDDTFLSELVLTKLSHNGCIPYSAKNGEEAVSLAEQYQPDVIILDLMLPGISGEELLIDFNKHDTLSKIPVIVFSNKSEDAEIKKVMDLGAIRFFVKSSTDLNVLSAAVKTAATSN